MGGPRSGGDWANYTDSFIANLAIQQRGWSRSVILLCKKNVVFFLAGMGWREYRWDQMVGARNGFTPPIPNELPQ